MDRSNDEIGKGKGFHCPFLTGKSVILDSLNAETQALTRRMGILSCAVDKTPVRCQTPLSKIICSFDKPYASCFEEDVPRWSPVEVQI